MGPCGDRGVIHQQRRYVEVSILEHTNAVVADRHTGADNVRTSVGKDSVALTRCVRGARRAFSGARSYGTGPGPEFHGVGVGDLRQHGPRIRDVGVDAVKYKSLPLDGR